MDAASLLLAVLGASVVSACQVAWEVTLHRRTMRHTTRETSAVMRRVDETVEKAEKDRENILASVKELRDVIERDTRERIERANAALAEERASIEAQIAEAERRLNEERAQMAAALDEARKSAEMRKRGAIGNAAQEAARVAASEAPNTAGELVALLESRIGPKGIEALQTAFPFAWEQAMNDPPGWTKYLRFALDKLPVMNGSRNGSHAPASSVPQPPF